MIEHRGHGNFLVRPKLEAKADETMSGPVEGERGEAAPEQVLRLAVELLLGRVGTRQ